MLPIEPSLPFARTTSAEWIPAVAATSASSAPRKDMVLVRPGSSRRSAAGRRASSSALEPIDKETPWQPAGPRTAAAANSPTACGQLRNPAPAAIKIPHLVIERMEPKVIFYPIDA